MAEEQCARLAMKLDVGFSVFVQVHCEYAICHRPRRRRRALLAGAFSDRSGNQPRRAAGRNPTSGDQDVGRCRWSCPGYGGPSVPRTRNPRPGRYSRPPRDFRRGSGRESDGPSTTAITAGRGIRPDRSPVRDPAGRSHQSRGSGTARRTNDVGIANARPPRSGL